MEIRVAVKVEGVKRVIGALEGHKHISAALQKWGVRYNRFMVDRYEKYSSGGGNWKRLKPNTIRYKSQNKTRKLVEFGDLLDKLKATVHLGVKRGLRLGMQAGITDKTGTHHSGLSIQDLAEIHQLGLGRVPARQLVVRPPKDVVNGMQADMQEAVEKIVEESKSTR